MNRIQRLFCKSVIQQNGEDTVLMRPASGQVLDKYGEPPNGVWVMDQFPITIAVEQDRREVEQTPIGGLPDDTKETLIFYIEGTSDIRTGDKIVYPPATPNQWKVFRLEPIKVKRVTAVIEVRCHRDSRE